jgi:hypothetical protein
VLPNTADPTSDEKPGNHFKNLTEMSVRFSPERCGVKSVLRKFESSESEVSHPWRGLLGEEGVVGTYLEEMLNSR